ncbi:MAG: hypothetical protein ACR2LK_11115 [Solirubrobacteraceae bacterium]
MTAPPSSVRRRLTLIAHFAAGQSSSHLLTIAAGFVALRTMAVGDFALYSLALAFTAVLGSLVDGGFTRSIVALVGKRSDDAELIARYVAVARSKRRVLAALLAPVACGLFMAATADRGWGLDERLVLVAGVAASVWLQSSIAMHAAPLLIRADIRGFYAPQRSGAAGRLTGYALAAAVGALTPVAAIAMNVVYFAFVGRRMRAASLRYVPLRRNAHRHQAAAMTAYLRPLWPNLILIAILPQLAIFAVAAPASAKAVGEAAALARIGALFIIAIAATGALVEPFIARTPQRQLARRYLAVAGLFAAGGAAMTLAVALEPQPILRLLGTQYDHLATEAKLTVLSGSVNILALLLFTMNSARRWVFGWQTPLLVVLVAAVAGTCAVLVDLATTRGAVTFTLLLHGAMLVVYAMCAAQGFRRDRTRPEPASTS